MPWREGPGPNVVSKHIKIKQLACNDPACRENICIHAIRYISHLSCYDYLGIWVLTFPVEALYPE